MSIASDISAFGPNFPGVPGSAAKKFDKKKQTTNVNIFSLRWGYKEWNQEYALKNLEGLQAILKVVCKDYIIQLEEGRDKDEKGNGYIHYQGWINVLDKTRPKALAGVLQGHGLGGVQINTASNEGKEQLKAYCMKKDTHVAGPWAYDPKKLEKLKNKINDEEHIEVYTGQDLPTYYQLLPWQKGIVDMIQTKAQKRPIYWLYDEIGNTGKTVLAKYLMYHHRATLGAWSDTGSMLYAVAKGVKSGRGKVFVFNLTRTKPKMFSSDDLYTSLESIKDGAILSTKYDSEPIAFMPPWVIVLSNTYPSKTALSRDRIKVIPIPRSQMPPPEVEAEYDASQIGQIMTIEQIPDVNPVGEIGNPVPGRGYQE